MNYKNLYPQHSQSEFINVDQSAYEPFVSFWDDYFFKDEEKKNKKKSKKSKHRQKNTKKLLKLMKKEGLILVDDSRKKHKKGKKNNPEKTYSSNPWEMLLATCMPKLIEVCGDCAKEYLKSKNEKN